MIAAAVAHFFAFSPSSTRRRMSVDPNIAGFRLAVASACCFKSQSIANFDTVRIYSRAFQFIDMQKHVRAASIVLDESEAAIGIPHFQFSGAHPITLFQPELDQALPAFPLKRPTQVDIHRFLQFPVLRKARTSPLGIATISRCLRP
jgi:hypothetical protein